MATAVFISAFSEEKITNTELMVTSAGHTINQIIRTAKYTLSAIPAMALLCGLWQLYFNE